RVATRLGANREAIRAFAATIRRLVTLKVARVPSPRTTTTMSPGRSSARRVKTADPVHQLTCPFSSAFPGRPGVGPRLYQATSWKSLGVSMFRLASRPRDSILALTAILGIRRRTGDRFATGATAWLPG